MKKRIAESNSICDFHELKHEDESDEEMLEGDEESYE